MTTSAASSSADASSAVVPPGRSDPPRPGQVGLPAHLQGLGVVDGVGYAPALWVRPRPALPTRGTALPQAERDEEKERFVSATGVVAARLTERAARATGHAAEVLTATAELVGDRAWQRSVNRNIGAGDPAPWAVVQATETFITKFEKIGGVIAERVTDLRDIRDRVIAELRGEPEPGVPEPDRPVILLAEDLAPADTAGLRPEVIAALVTELGGKTSHTAIIARQLGIPCIVAVGPGLREVPADTALLVDGRTGVIETAPDETVARENVRRDAAVRERIRAWSGPAHTSDGHRVQLLANVQDGAAARKAAAAGAAEGVGLFRTELCFLSSTTEPTVEEQAAIYRDVLEAFDGRKVVIRTLDAGSDKPIAFADLPPEDNPALGVRGLRVGRRTPGLITRQLDAIALAARGRDPRPWVMAPMVATVEEAEWFAGLCRPRDLVPGIMVEVPGAALLAERLLAKVEFFSLGTNDLSQYTMAADRLSPHLVTLTDPWQPAVLSLVKMSADAGTGAGKSVGVCGEAAADPLLACVLVGLGITSLSAATPALPAVGARLASVDLETCRWVAGAAVAQDSATGAREAASAVLDPAAD